ncbi:MAG: hypothetical protein H6980_00775 [Gammaproteobacteria bacterium]|nr:hypothetical protein [Gammaproteobacteria bacterium]
MIALKVAARTAIPTSAQSRAMHAKPVEVIVDILRIVMVVPPPNGILEAKRLSLT